MSEEEYMTTEGVKELDYVKDYIITKARLLALKERRKDMDQVHIKEATKALFVKSGKITWALGSSVALLSIALFQISALLTLSLELQPTLWILPIFGIIWFMIVSYVLRDFLTP